MFSAMFIIFQIMQLKLLLLQLADFMSVMKLDTMTGQTLEPGTQQGRGFHLCGKYPAGRTDIRFNTELFHPVLNPDRIPLFDPRGQPLHLIITLYKLWHRLSMGNIQAGLSCHQEFSRGRRLLLIDMQLIIKLTEHFCCH